MSKLVARNLLLSLTLLLLPAIHLAAQVNVIPGDWRRLGPDGGSVLDLVSAPSNSQVLYASLDGQVYRSANGGGSCPGRRSGPLGVHGLGLRSARPM